MRGLGTLLSFDSSLARVPVTPAHTQLVSTEPHGHSWETGSIVLSLVAMCCLKSKRILEGPGVVSAIVRDYFLDIMEIVEFVLMKSRSQSSREGS